MKFNNLYTTIIETLQGRERGEDIDNYPFDWPPKDIHLFRRKVFDDAEFKVGKSHDILWRPNSKDIINGLYPRNPSFPKDLPTDAFYKATTIPLKSKWETAPLSSSLAPTVRLNVHEGPYKGSGSLTSYYGIFPPTYKIKKAGASEEQAQTILKL